MSAHDAIPPKPPPPRGKTTREGLSDAPEPAPDHPVARWCCEDCGRYHGTHPRWPCACGSNRLVGQLEYRPPAPPFPEGAGMLRSWRQVALLLAGLVLVSLALTWVFAWVARHAWEAAA